jgi:hypothetical protein
MYGRPSVHVRELRNFHPETNFVELPMWIIK